MTTIRLLLTGTKPTVYLDNLLGHEGEGSLLSLLKQRGWATSLWAGSSETGENQNSSFFLFEVCIRLSEAGFEVSIPMFLPFCRFSASSDIFPFNLVFSDTRCTCVTHHMCCEWSGSFGSVGTVVPVLAHAQAHRFSKVVVGRE